MPVVIDVWGGDNSMDHLARFLRMWDAEAQALVTRELSAGFLVNVRREIAWGDYKDFDDRQAFASSVN